jgi:DNA-binding transcriptional MerR regulator
MSQAAAPTKKILRRRDVMDLLGISEREYRTYVEAGLLVPLKKNAKRHIFTHAALSHLLEKPTPST